MTIPRLQYLVGPHNNIQKKFELSTPRPDIVKELSLHYLPMHCTREANKNMKNSSFFLESTESTETPDVLPSSQLIG